jgi:uncharacterized membrane protein
MRIRSAGHAVFAATMIALGIMGLIKGNFAPMWDGVPKDLPGRAVLAYLSAVVSLACGIGLFWKRTAAIAACVLLVTILLWFLLFKLRYIIAAPLVEGSYQNCGETVAMLAGAWVLFDWFAGGWNMRRLGFAIGETGLRIARALYALALIAFGLSHFDYLDLTAPLVPGWLPAHVFWAYFTGAAYLAAGAAILLGVVVRLAAVLAAWQIGLITLLVWVPIVAAGPNAFQWSETVLSWAITTAAWVIAESCRSIPWLAVNTFKQARMK